jgi:hypothetical protein
MTSLHVYAAAHICNQQGQAEISQAPHVECLSAKKEGLHVRSTGTKRSMLLIATLDPDNLLFSYTHKGSARFTQN